MGLTWLAARSILESAGTGSAGHEVSLWQLLREATLLAFCDTKTQYTVPVFQVGLT